MDAALIAAAAEAALAVAADGGLDARKATTLHASNAVTLRVRPCDVVARVTVDTAEARAAAGFETDIAARLAGAGCPTVGPLTVGGRLMHPRSGFLVSLWPHRENLGTPLAAADYAAALVRLHRGLRTLDADARTPVVPPVTDRVAAARRLLDDPALTPRLPAGERRFLTDVITAVTPSVASAQPTQCLHGEPHPGNLIVTGPGPVFVDFETVCRGPVEFDLAHAPEEVSAHYPGLDLELRDRCRALVLAMIITWRWDRDDRLPDGARRRAEWSTQLHGLAASVGVRGLRSR